jgi:hypothetical protein
MREWYRRKLRELAASQDTRAPGASATGGKAGTRQTIAGRLAEDVTDLAEALPSGSRDILSLTEQVAPGDRQLGELLRSLELVETETLTALLGEARRQRRSLRQMLLAAGYLTLYQLALIEAGNLDALVLGPTRVVDRLRATPRETVYCVFDPRAGREVLLRHLSEAEAHDAVRPDEFRQRFAAAAAVRHPHLAATLEVLDIAGRPAVLQEVVTGLPSTDWPALAAVPGVWYRLLGQAALGLQTIHQAGLVHGHISAAALVLTADGVVKLCGLGEPSWLIESAAEEERPVSSAGAEDAPTDQVALMRVATGWVRLGVPSGKKPRRFPEPLQAILDRFTTPSDEPASAAALLEALEQVSGSVPANAEAWDRLLHHVRDHITSDKRVRRSA